MESVETALKINHVIFTTVEGIKPSPEGDWVHFSGSRESLLFPTGSYIVGTEMKITFEKVTNAKV